MQLIFVFVDMVETVKMRDRITSKKDSVLLVELYGLIELVFMKLNNYLILMIMIDTYNHHLINVIKEKFQ